MNDIDVLQQRLTQWCEVFSAKLQSQASLMEVLDEQLDVEFQMLVGADTKPDQLTSLRGAVLNRADDSWRADFAIDLHERVEVVIESVHSRLAYAYEDYLRRHWQARPNDLVDGSAYDARIEQLLNVHAQAVREMLGAELNDDGLHKRVLKLQDLWREQPALQALASAEELMLLEP